MLNLAGKGSMEECILMADKAIENHSALDKLAEMVKMQGGDERYIYDTSLFKKAPYSYEWISESDMYITQMDTEQCGKTSVLLGAGREIKDSVIDFTAGIKFYKKTGDYVKKGDIIAVLYSSDKEKLNKAAGYLKQAYKTGRSKVEKQKTIIAYVSKNNVIMY